MRGLTGIFTMAFVAEMLALSCCSCRDRFWKDTLKKAWKSWAVLSLLASSLPLFGFAVRCANPTAKPWKRAGLEKWSSQDQDGMGSVYMVRRSAAPPPSPPQR